MKYSELYREVGCVLDERSESFWIREANKKNIKYECEVR